MNSSMRKGFMTGCDQNTEWMLPWFIENYKKHNDTPLTVMNFGMSNQCLEWLETQVHSIGMMRNILVFYTVQCTGIIHVHTKYGKLRP